MVSTEYLKRLFGLDDQVAVVIGGGGSVGAALCEGLAQAGANLVIAGRSMARGHKCVEMVRALAGRAGYCHVDVTSRDSLTALREYAVGEYGRIDMLVNCAALVAHEPAGEHWPSSPECAPPLNLWGAYWACQIFGRQMAGQPARGCILNLGCPKPSPLDEPAGSAANRTAALATITRQAACELGPRGVRVNLLCSGSLAAPAGTEPSAIQEQLLSHTLLARCGEPRELIAAALVLVSRAAGGFVTGAAWHVDGGYSATTA